MAYGGASPAEAALLGVTSIALTNLNIACIFIMATVVFKIKEVVPKAALSSGESWSLIVVVVVVVIVVVVIFVIVVVVIVVVIVVIVMLLLL